MYVKSRLGRPASGGWNFETARHRALLTTVVAFAATVCGPASAEERQADTGFAVTPLLNVGSLQLAEAESRKGAAPTAPRQTSARRNTSQPNATQQAQLREQSFEIAAGDLQSALLAFSRQVDLQLLYPADLTAGLDTAGVHGRFAPEQALRRLLAGTGLIYSYTTANTIALSRPAGDAGGGAIRLNPITVTGEKTDRSLRDTASSVAVFDARDIEERPGLTSTNNVFDRLANVTTSGTGNFAPTIRGVDGTGPAQGADAFFAGTRPRLNIQADGRPLSYNEAVFGDISLWDVEQVEILRGPQSTLQGRNAIAGTMVVRTKDPTFDFEAGGRVLGGNQDLRQGSVYVSGPIVEDQLAFRLAFDRSTRESYAHFENYGDVEPDEYESTTLRGKLLIEPRSWEDFSAMLTVNHSEYSGPQAEFIARPFGEHVSSTPAMPVFNPRSTSGTIDATWDLSDNVALEGTASLTDLTVKRFAPPGTGNVQLNGLEIVAEPRIRFSGFHERLNGLAGLYVFRAKQDETIDFLGDGSFDDRTTTVALFGEASYEILEDIDLTLGARVEQEHRRRTGGTGPFNIDLDETYTAVLPKLGVAWHASEEVTLGAMVSRGYNGGGAGFTYNPPFESYTYDPEYAWTYETYVRTDLLDDRLSLTGNVFYSQYRDMQLPFDLNPDPAVWSTVVRNADEAITYGAEIGARWIAAPGLELFGDLGLLKTEVTSYPGSGIEGNELAQSPAFTSDFGLIYRHDSGFEFGADARFSDAYYSNINNDPRGKTDPYVVVNSQIGYSFSDAPGAPRIFAFVNNIFDNQEPIYLEPGATSANDVANIIPPRTFGVGFEMSF